MAKKVVRLEFEIRKRSCDKFGSGWKYVVAYMFLGNHWGEGRGYSTVRNCPLSMHLAKCIQHSTRSTLYLIGKPDLFQLAMPIHARREMHPTKY
jgi:hypothetical protein